MSTSQIYKIKREYYQELHGNIFRTKSILSKIQILEFNEIETNEFIDDETDDFDLQSEQPYKFWRRVRYIRTETGDWLFKAVVALYPTRHCKIQVQEIQDSAA